jgi:hypothetical protein
MLSVGKMTQLNEPLYNKGEMVLHVDKEQDYGRQRRLEGK